MTKAPTAKPAPATPPAGAPTGDRIAKVLSRAGIASRREAERLIAAGEVAVNGKVIDSPALNVGPADRITVSGQPVGQPEPARLWLYYKPEGLVTSASDEKGRDTVFQHLPEDMPRVMSIGRLDLNSEGLLLLTNDGELKRRLELPSTGWLRKYRVRVKGNPTDPDLEPLRKGIVVDGEKFQPMTVVLDRHQGANAWLTIGLREGKNREIRRAINALGMIVNRLIRISYGPFRLNELQPGAVEEVRPRILRDQLGLTGEASDDFAPAAPKPAVKTVSRGAARKPSGPRPRDLDASDPAKRAPAAPKSRPPRPEGGAARRGPAGAPAPAGDAPRRFGTAATKPGTAKPGAAKAGPAAGKATAKPAPRAKPQPAGDSPAGRSGTGAAARPPSKPRPAPTGGPRKPRQP